MTGAGGAVVADGGGAVGAAAGPQAVIVNTRINMTCGRVLFILPPFENCNCFGEMDAVMAAVLVFRSICGAWQLPLY
jgi:hypothetical protein